MFELVKPVNTAAMAPPCRSGPTRLAATTVATPRNPPWAAPARIRPAMTPSSVGAIAEAMLASANIAISAASNLALGIRTVARTMIGPPKTTPSA